MIHVPSRFTLDGHGDNGLEPALQYIKSDIDLDALIDALGGR